LDEFYWYS